MTGAHLVQFFLPVLDNDRQQFPREAFAQVRTELTEHTSSTTAGSSSHMPATTSQRGAIHNCRTGPAAP